MFLNQDLCNFQIHLIITLHLFLNKNHDPTKESKYILYLDANNLYGWAMQQKLSIGNYKWENPSLFTEKYINNINENGQDVLYIRG